MIEVKNLVKEYGQHRALNGISFKVDVGEVVGFLGPNGAGKTTAMNIMTGFIAATSGDVTINGVDIVTEPELTKASIGYLPDTPPVYGEMRVIEYLNFAADIKRVKKKRREQIGDILAQLSLSDAAHRLIRNLSRGYRQRVGLAQAMVGEPKVIIMDEPTTGLDPKQIIEMRSVVKNLGKKHTVILSSHIMQEVSAVCDRVIIINKGNIVATGTPEALSERLGKGTGRMLARVKGEQAVVRDALREYPEIILTDNDLKEHGTTDLVIEPTDPATDIRELFFHCMAANNIPILMMKPSELSLEEIFLSLTTNDFLRSDSE